MKDQINKSYFSNSALDNLKKKLDFFQKWKHFEIIDTQFYKDENDNISAEPRVRTGDNTHLITFQYHPNSESWSLQAHSFKNFGSTND